jgi:hypothetical protein
VAAAALAWQDISANILICVIATGVTRMALLRIRSAVSSKRAHLLEAVLV